MTSTNEETVLARHIVDNSLLDAVEMELFASEEKIERDRIMGDYPSKEEVEHVLRPLFESLYPDFKKNEERLGNILNAYVAFTKDEEVIFHTTKEFHNCDDLLIDLALHPNSALINKIVFDCEYDIRWQFVQQLHKAFVTICKDHEPHSTVVVVAGDENNEEEVNGENVVEIKAESVCSDDEDEQDSNNVKMFNVKCKTLTHIILPSIINQWNAEHEDTPSAIIDLEKMIEHFQCNDAGGSIVTFTHNMFYDWILIPSGFKGTKHQSNQIFGRFEDFFGCDQFETDSELKERILNTCYMRTSVKSFSVDENFDTSTGNCSMTLVVTLYWIPRKKRMKAKRNRETNEWTNPWWAQLDFPDASSAINGDIDDATKKEYQISVEKMHFSEFFGILENRGKGVEPETDEKEEKKDNDDDITDADTEKEVKDGCRMENIAEKFFRAGITSEHIYYKETEYELELGEPFELKAFPFDYQDLPITVKPSNFQYLAPAIINQTHSISPSQESQTIPTVFAGTQITNLGNWNLRLIMSEYESMRGSCNILMKMERNWKPFILKYTLVFGFVTALSFTVFSIDDGEVSEKVGTVLGLILTLIFVDLPEIPIVTMVHKYFYMCFAFLVVLAGESAFSDNEFMIESNGSIMLGFALLLAAIHLVFAVGIMFTLYFERKKGEMTSSEIIELNERGLKEIEVMGENPTDMCSRTNAVLIGRALPIGNASFQQREKLVKYFRELAFVPIGLNIICLQFPIAFIQLIANTDFGCTFKSIPFKTADAEINTDVIVFLCSAAISFMILLFVYVAVGITERHMNVFQSVFVVVLNINLALSIEFFSFWSNADGYSENTFVECTEISADSEKSLHLLQWWLLLISIITATISLAWTLLSDALGAILEGVKGWALGNIMLSLYHFIIVAATALQWTSIKLVESADHSVNVDNDILPISVLETCLGLLIPQLIRTLNWWMGRVAMGNFGWDWARYFQISTFCEICINLLQMSIAIHSLVFWVALDDYTSHNISEGRRIALIVMFGLLLIACVPAIYVQHYFAVYILKEKQKEENRKNKVTGEGTVDDEIVQCGCFKNLC